MASIANATVVYVAVGGGGTPLEIYNKQNQWITVNGNYGDIMLYHDNGDGTMKVVGISSQFTPTQHLPTGYVFNGNGSINLGDSNLGGSYYVSVNDGNNSYFTYGYGSGVNTTINVRKTN